MSTTADIYEEIIIIFWFLLFATQCTIIHSLNAHGWNAKPLALMLWLITIVCTVGGNHTSTILREVPYTAWFDYCSTIGERLFLMRGILNHSVRVYNLSEKKKKEKITNKNNDDEKFQGINPVVPQTLYPLHILIGMARTLTQE